MARTTYITMLRSKGQSHWAS